MAIPVLGGIADLWSGLSGVNPIEQRQGVYPTGGQIQLYPQSWISPAYAAPASSGIQVTPQMSAEQQAFQNYMNQQQQPQSQQLKRKIL